MAKNFRDNKKISTETTHLGTFIHPAGELLVLKLEHKDVPYPNSPVLLDRKQIGKVDEVFGPLNDVYVAVRLESGSKVSNFRLEAKFEAYKDKFIFRDKFLPREEVERKKEQNDRKKQSENTKSKGGKSFGRGGPRGGSKYDKKPNDSNRDRRDFKDSSNGKFQRDDRNFKGKRDFNNNRK